MSAETRGRSGTVLAIMCAGMFLVLLDVTAVNVALPTIRADLDTGLGGQQWVVDAYAVALAGLLLGGGAIGDRVGHRTIVLTGLGLFGAASAACGLAPGVGALVAARAAQGAGAALLLPGTLAIVADTFPGRAEQARALGVWAAVSSLALPAGPLLGGAVVAAGGWRPVFLINVPVVVAAAEAVRRWVPRRPPAADRGAALDVPGLVTAPIALGAAVFAVIAAERSGAAGSGAAAAVAVAAGAVFVWLERRSPAPVLPLRLLRRPAFVGANCVALLMNLACNGTIFVTTLDLQSVRHIGALAAGAALLPLALPLMTLAPVAGRLTARFGPRTPMACGIALGAVGAAGMLLVGTDTPYTMLLPTLLGVGTGCGLLTTAVVAAAVRSVPAAQSGLASGVNNAMRQTGTAAGVAVFGAVAGSPEHVGAFVAGWHHLAWAALGIWGVAMALALLATAAPRAKSVAGQMSGAPS